MIGALYIATTCCEAEGDATQASQDEILASLAALTLLVTGTGDAATQDKLDQILESVSKPELC